MSLLPLVKNLLNHIEDLKTADDKENQLLEELTNFLQSKITLSEFSDIEVETLCQFVGGEIWAGHWVGNNARRELQSLGLVKDANLTEFGKKFITRSLLTLRKQQDSVMG